MIKKKEVKLKASRPRYWMCVIGPVADCDVPFGGDFAPRMAARNAILTETKKDPPCSSGWMEEDEYIAITKAKYAKYESIKR